MGRPPSVEPERLARSYRRYLLNFTRADFDLAGVPIRVTLRLGENPYVQAEEP